jgi:hypothetical protein
VLIQILMVALIIAFPNLVSGGLATKEKIDIKNIQIEIPAEEQQPGGTESSPGSSEQEDAEKALERSMSGDKASETPAGSEKAAEPPAGSSAPAPQPPEQKK